MWVLTALPKMRDSDVMIWVECLESTAYTRKDVYEFKGVRYLWTFADPGPSQWWVWLSYE